MVFVILSISLLILAAGVGLWPAPSPGASEIVLTAKEFVFSPRE